MKNMRIDRTAWIEGLEVLSSVAAAVPVLGAPIAGSVEAVQQILEYTEVGTSSFDLRSDRV
jgi:hypothetical protein